MQFVQVQSCIFVHNKHSFYCSVKVYFSLFFDYLIIYNIFPIFFTLYCYFFHSYFAFLLLFPKVCLCNLSFLTSFSVFFCYFFFFNIKKLLLLSLFLTVFLKFQVFFQSSCPVAPVSSLFCLFSGSFLHFIYPQYILIVKEVRHEN